MTLLHVKPSNVQTSSLRDLLISDLYFVESIRLNYLAVPLTASLFSSSEEAATLFSRIKSLNHRSHDL